MIYKVSVTSVKCSNLHDLYSIKILRHIYGVRGYDKDPG